MTKFPVAFPLWNSYHGCCYSWMTAFIEAIYLRYSYCGCCLSCMTAFIAFHACKRLDSLKICSYVTVDSTASFHARLHSLKLLPYFTDAAAAACHAWLHLCYSSCYCSFCFCGIHDVIFLSLKGMEPDFLWHHDHFSFTAPQRRICLSGNALLSMFKIWILLQAKPDTII